MMHALSIRQPYAEQILRGIKTIEYRSRPTTITGERFYIYAARKWAGINGHGTDGLAEGDAPTGVIVGTAVVSHVTNGGTGPTAYEWHLTQVRRLPKPRKPKRQPQPVWFRPF